MREASFKAIWADDEWLSKHAGKTLSGGNAGVKLTDSDEEVPEDNEDEEAKNSGDEETSAEAGAETGEKIPAVPKAKTNPQVCNQSIYQSKSLIIKLIVDNAGFL